VSQETSNHSFDELTRGLASGSISRGRAIRLMGAALVGGTLASFPGVGWAAKGGRSSCAKFCQSLFGANTPEEAECVSQGTKGQGPCFTCTTETGCGPNFTRPPCTVTGQTYICSTCRCECPSGTTPCGGNCVSTTCGPNQKFDTSSCTCVACTPIAGTCSFNDQCCSGRCADGTCAEPCPSDRVLLDNGTCAKPCNSNFDCAGCLPGGFAACENHLEGPHGRLCRGSEPLSPCISDRACPTGQFCAAFFGELDACTTAC